MTLCDFLPMVWTLIPQPLTYCWPAVEGASHYAVEYAVCDECPWEDGGTVDAPEWSYLDAAHGDRIYVRASACDAASCSEPGPSSLPVAVIPDYDLDASGVVTISDFNLFRPWIGLDNPALDCDRSGMVTIADLGCFRDVFNRRLGADGVYR